MIYDLLMFLDFPYFEIKLVLQFFAMIILCCSAIYIQYKRLNKTLPIFDPGIILILVTTIYCSYPIFSFAMSGFTWTEISDRRLWDYNVSTPIFSYFMLMPFYYLLSLISSYILFCGVNFKPITQQPKLSSLIKKSDALIVLFLFLSLKIFFYLINTYFLKGRPLYLMQIINLLSSLNFVLFLYLLVYTFVHWKNHLFKACLIVLISFQGYLTFIEGYGRTTFFLQILSCLLAYHFFIKKIKFRYAAFGFVFLFLTFIIRGFLKVGMIQYFGEYSVFSAANEFTVLIGTAFDIYSRIQNGLIDFIPLQAYFNDFLLLIPSQFLPFQKMDLSLWYIEQLNLQGTGVGMMFGVISQGVIGGGTPELIIRGLVLGFLFAKLFKWFYGKTNVTIWEVVFMIFVAVKSYYTYRAGTGYLLYFIIYHFFGAYFLYYIISIFLEKLNLKK